MYKIYLLINPKNRKKIFLLSLILVAFVVYFTFTNYVINDELVFDTKMIKLDDVSLEVEIADTIAKRQQGLQFREKLSYNQGMLFDFSKPQNISIWMPNMKFSLDILWFDDDGNLVHMEKDVPPCTSIDLCKSIKNKGEDARYILELTSGFVQNFNITQNSKLYLE